MKIFLICPVRNTTPEIKNFLENYVAELENKGDKVHYPPRDTNQNDPIGINICEQNHRAIFEADEIHIYYDQNSTGTLFDFGGAFMLTRILGLKKKIVFINKKEVSYDAKKSFQKVLKFLDENM